MPEFVETRIVGALGNECCDEAIADGSFRSLPGLASWLVVARLNTVVV
jgi:hypothetical protein